MKLSFYPLEITYAVLEEKAVIRIFGRTAQGEQICVEDRTFQPYFTITGTPDIDEISKISQDDSHVVGVEQIKKNLNEHEIIAYRIYVNLPKAVPILKKQLSESKGVDEIYEHDILFARRYLIDKQISPFVLTYAEAELIDSKLKVKCYNAKKVWQESEQILTEPRILALDIETYNPDNILNPKQNPILMIGVYGMNFSKVVTWKKFPTKEKYIEFVPTEADMLNRFKELVEEYEPDIITGYFTDGFDFPYLVQRAKQHKVTLDLGLDYSPVLVKGRTHKEVPITGIAHIDVFKFIRRVIGRSLDTDSYTLDAVSKEILGDEKIKVDMEELFKAWDETSKELDLFAKYNLQDCKLTYDLTVKLLPSLIEFVRIVGLKPYDVNRMSFSTFVEWYLIKQAYKRNEIILNRPSHNEQRARMHDRIKGAFVYEPKPGFYKSIAVFDYRSLYPSIIAAHNISKGMLNCDCCGEQKIETERGDFHYCKKRQGLFSTVIKNLILYRAEIKKKLKQKDDAMLSARANALKVLANSFYGYMGFAPARWYCIECAESTTAWARQYIHQAIDAAQKEGFTVLYSDTDSIFLLLDKKTKEDALKFAEEVNKKLPELMELEYEGYYPAGIFVSLRASQAGAKKKYALIDEKNNITIKGFETVRRNWSFIAKEVQQKVIEILLKDQDSKAAKQYVNQIISELRTNKIPKEKMVIKTALSKGTSGYATVGPHVAAAQKMEERGQKVGSGTIVAYIVAKGEGKIRDKVKLPDEISQKDYDGEYYIQNQIIPGIERIFAALGIPVEDLLNSGRQKTLGSW